MKMFPRKDVVFTGNMKRFEHFEEIIDLCG